MAWSGAGVLSFLIVARAVHGISVLDPASLILEGLLGVILVLIWLSHLGYVLEASLFLILISWSAMFYQAWIGSGVRDTAVAGQLIIVLACSLLLGWQASAGLALLSILSIWGMAIFEMNGVLHPTQDDVYGVARDMPAVFLLSGTFTYLILSNLQQHVEAMRNGEER